MKPYKAIAAMSHNRVIGAGARIPWHLPEDFKWFKRMTEGHIIVMGRKTFESIGKPLPNRINVVLSRSMLAVADVHIISTLAQLPSIQAKYAGREVFICGGAQVYGQGLAFCSDLYLTLVKQTVAGDTFFPEFEHQFVLEKEILDCADFKITHYRSREE